MTSRIRKAIERMLANAVPTSPLTDTWFHDVNRLRFSKLPNRLALSRARELQQQAQPLMSRYEIRQWQRI